MEGPVVKAKTSERLFFLPGNVGHEVATQTGSSELATRDDRRFPARLREREQFARSYIRSTLIAISTAFNGEIERGTLFLFLPVFAGTGAILYFNAGSEPRLSATLSGLTVLAGFHALAHARPMIRLALLFAIAMVVGMLFGKLETIRAGTRTLGSEVTTRITGRITAMTKDAKGGWRVTMDVISTERPYLRYGPDRILVSAKALPRALNIGDGLSGLVHLRPQSGPMRSGNYDFAFYNYYRGIGANGFLLGKADIVPMAAATGSTTTILMTIANIRQQLTQRIVRNIKGEPGDIAASLIKG